MDLSTVQNLSESDKELSKNLVFVLIHPGDSHERWNSYHRKGELFQQYIRFMTEEFIPEVEKELTSSNLHIVKRGLLGDSLGGNISLNIALCTPHLWTHLLLQSAAVSEEEIEAVNFAGQLDWSIYQTVGLYEDEFISPITNTKLHILSRNRKLYDAFIKQSANVLYSEQEEEHVWVFWRNDLLNALKFFIEKP